MRIILFFILFSSNSFAHQLIFETDGFSLISAKVFKTIQPVTIENKKHSDIWVRLTDDKGQVLQVFKILMNSSRHVMLKQEKKKKYFVEVLSPPGKKVLLR